MEAQATDRTYRIGQKREVNVYFLINQSSQIGRTFDQILDELMERKKVLAEKAFESADFLAVNEDEQKLGMDLYESLGK